MLLPLPPRIHHADESPFHCLDCSGSQFFNIHRHHAVRNTTINVSSAHTSILSVLPKEPLVLPPADYISVTDLCDEARGHNTTLQIGPRQSVSDFRTSRAFARNSGLTRADCGFITSTNRRYIDMTVSNPTAPTNFPRPVLDPHGNPILPTAGVSCIQQIRTARKQARYRPVLGDLAADPDHLAISLVEATTGRLADPAMKLLKFIVQDSPSRSILNHFCTQIGGAIARYNAMAALAWVQYYLRSSHISVGEVAG